MLVASLVQDASDLEQILALQQKNLRGKIDPATEQSQGFVTVTHNLQKLQQLHAQAPSVVVKDGQVLAGYALVMTRDCAALIPELLSMYEGLSSLHYLGRPLIDFNFYVMGQVCVAEAYRGRGIFDLLYTKHKEVYQQQFDFVITEIATRNTRSMRAHQRVGFKTLHIHRDELDEWAVVVWDWR